MPNWNDLRDNQLVDRNALLDAIANGFQTLQGGQIVPAGQRCVSVAEAQAWLKLDTSSLPTSGRMPVKSELVPANSTVRVVLTEIDYVDVNLFFSIDNVEVFDPAASDSQTFTVRGGKLISASITGYVAATLANGQKHLRVTENNVVIYNNATPSPAPGDVDNWHKFILAGADYLIEAFSTGDTTSGDGTYIYINNSGFDIPFTIYQSTDNGAPVIESGPLANQVSMNLIPYLSGSQGPNYVIRFFAPVAGIYTFTPGPGGAANTIEVNQGQLIDSVSLNDALDNMNNYNVNHWTITLSVTG